MLQYDRTCDRDDHIGKTVWCVKSAQVSWAIGCLPCRFVLGSTVEDGSNGRVRDGVIRLLRFVLIVSSSWALDMRRKSRK